MNREKFLLMKLAEECSELAHQAVKQIQFGMNERQKNQDSTNGDRLRSEFLDLIAVASMLQESGQFPKITREDIADAIVNKRIKMQKYLILSASLGELPEIWL